jgi:hypothetical protein
MKKLVRESIDIYGPGYTTNITWEQEDKEGNPIEEPYKDTRNIEDDPHIPIAPVPPTSNKTHPFMGGEDNTLSTFGDNKKSQNTFKGTVGYDDDGFPYKKIGNIKVYPKGYKLMKILEFIIEKGDVGYRDIQRVAYDITYGDGAFESVYKRSMSKSNRGYYSTNLNKWMHGYRDWNYYTSKPGKYYSALISQYYTPDKKHMYTITDSGYKKYQELNQNLSKFQKQ